MIPVRIPDGVPRSIQVSFAEKVQFVLVSYAILACVALFLAIAFGQGMKEHPRLFGFRVRTTQPKDDLFGFDVPNKVKRA